MVQARKFNSVKAAQDWLTKRGYSLTGMHVWSNGKVTAWVCIQLGGYRAAFIVAEG